MDVGEALELVDWRQRVFDLYRQVRTADEPQRAWEWWKRERDELFARHPQSPLAHPAAFPGLAYYDYDPASRVLADLEPAEQAHIEVPMSTGAPVRFSRIARARFDVRGERAELDVFWLESYGGGLFLPLRDATSGDTTYGGGRYLLDTVKGADLGTDGDSLVLDFNFAYNPSCAYDARWSCPLAPPANRLEQKIEAGEKIPPASAS